MVVVLLRLAMGVALPVEAWGWFTVYTRPLLWTWWYPVVVFLKIPRLGQERGGVSVVDFLVHHAVVHLLSAKAKLKLVFITF